MAITNKVNGLLTITPTILLTTATPTSRLAKGMVINNKDSISHTFVMELGSATIFRMLLKAGDTLIFNTTVALGSDNLVGYMDEALSTSNPTYIITYLDEAETV